ncbi:MAG: APC family permease, partial [Acidobacteriota bacterium]
MPLKRVLGRRDATWIVAGNMVGAGIFVTPGSVAAHLPGAAWLLLAWLAGGLLALAGAAVYGELGSRLPRTGGDYRYLHEAFGPLPAFLSGWAAFLLTFSAAAAAMAITVIDYLQQAFPVLEAWPPLLVRLAGGALILMLTAANAAGAKPAGRTTMLLTALPLAGLGLFLIVGLLGENPAIAWPRHVWQSPAEAWPMALGLALVPIYFTYSGWNAAAYMAGELKDARRVLPLALLGGTALVTGLYLAVNGAILAVVPGDEMAGSTTAAALAAGRLVGPRAVRGLALVIALAITGSANVTLMAGARIYYAMARDGLAPRTLEQVNRGGVPGAALWAAGIWTALLAVQGSFSLLLSWSTLAILLFSSLTVAGLMVLRRRPGPAPLYCCPGYPATLLLYLAA